MKVHPERIEILDLIERTNKEYKGRAIVEIIDREVKGTENFYHYGLQIDVKVKINNGVMKKEKLLKEIKDSLESRSEGIGWNSVKETVYDGDITILSFRACSGLGWLKLKMRENNGDLQKDGYVRIA